MTESTAHSESPGGMRLARLAPHPQQERDVRKRIRSESFYPRRRSVTACNTCRGRKTKCDNARPVCGFCAGIGAQCSYEEPASGLSNYDKASLDIIDRLERIENLMEGLNIQQGRAESFESESSRPFNHTSPQLTAYIPVVETLLEWPIFKELNLDLHGRSLALIHDVSQLPGDSHFTNSHCHFERTFSNENIELESMQIRHALRNFVANVHCKNPIVEPDKLNQAVEHYIQGNPKNDEESALASIVCALGLVATPYRCSAGVDEQVDDAERAEDSKNVSYQLFQMSQRTLSVLPPSLLTIQCYFFGGVYEMFSLRPVSAWYRFNQACLQLRVFLIARNVSEDTNLPTMDVPLINRLYWSCMQTECELSAELRLKSSGLEELHFPWPFPSPPENYASDQASVMDSIQLASWMYYLSETSLRRICNEVVWTLYKHVPAAWMDDIEASRVQAMQLEQQLQTWIAHLPKQIDIDGDPQSSSNELALHIRSRCLMCRSWIYRPFLYYMVHAPYTGLSQHRRLVEPLAYSALECSVDLIRDVTYYHRHHGTWFTARIAFVAALCLLAAARRSWIPMPPAWENDIQRAIAILAIWAPESPNLRASKEILERLFVATTSQAS